MKKIFLTTVAIMLLMLGSLAAQDPAVDNPSFDPNPLELATAGLMSFNFSNFGVAVPVTVGMTVTIGFQKATPSAPTGDGAAYFDWTYFPGLNSYRGVQSTEVPGFIFGQAINFPVLVFDEPAAMVGDIVGFNINLGNVGSITPPNNTASDAVNLTGNIAPLGGLPVELTNFFGRNTQEGNLLLWETASELNNSGFEVEKSSNGRDWKMIDWVDGKGTTHLVNNYELLDKDPFLGDNYYRLKQVDFDGAFEYSRMINIQTEGSVVEIEVLPNPSPGDVKVTVMNPNKEKMSISLLDSAGKLIFETGLI